MFGDKRKKTIKARFITSKSLAVQSGGRWLSRFRVPPKNIEFKLDAKDADIWTGDLVDITTRHVPDATGAGVETRFQITSAEEITKPGPGTQYKYRAVELNYQDRYAWIGPNTLNDYDVESEANKLAYGFIALDTALFSDNSPAYRII